MNLVAKPFRTILSKMRKIIHNGQTCLYIIRFRLEIEGLKRLNSGQEIILVLDASIFFKTSSIAQNYRLNLLMK